MLQLGSKQSARYYSRIVRKQSSHVQDIYRPIETLQGRRRNDLSNNRLQISIVAPATAIASQGAQDRFGCDLTGNYF